MAGKIIAVAFLSRDIAHKEHLKTKSFAQHSALGSFYDDIIGVTDSFAEMYQGRYGIINDIPTISLKGGKNIADKLEMLMGMIEAERKEYAQNDTPIQNKIDEIVGLYLSTLYKLRNLQ